ncbi:MAG: peptidase S41 [Sandaracinus sp.]|nr:peptidase S41 [Sandaracinus sp.]|tara:strand:- start:2737 stop:5829 length:3093 start_codon:yes stop_codon:yes gene_type:complete
MESIKRLWKPLLALMAVVSAFFLTFGWPPRNGLQVDLDGSGRAQAAANMDPYDLTQLKVLNRALFEVKDHYVEPERIDYQRMFLAGLNAIQRAVAPVIVHYQEGQSELTVQVRNERRSFGVAVDSPWSLARRYKDVFGFLQSELASEEDIELRDIEYAAVNGMLRTLDPHTILLTPDVFEEMQMSTRGEFGGLGIVISIRDGHLTVIRPMPGTPAARAGLERMDRIVKINDESTLNMPLNEAVDRLRGPPGSQVSVWVRRRQANGNWSNPRRVELTRAVIHIESVEHRMLGDGIGYVSINNFQGNTHEDLQRALADLHGQELKGLVLDLRDNPGGLLDQAVRIADTFLSSGTIVRTSSPDERQRDEKFARPEGTEPDYPMVVLINGSSASASEIVAGALKNHDRALVIGQRSFGKGSVQVLQNFQDGSALKLTIAQYLTPGDVSIQGVGIVPDIGIDPMTVDEEDMDLDIDPESYLREADLQSHLTNQNARDSGRPSVVLRYYLNREMRQQLREADPRDTENEEEDEFLTRFAKQLLTHATHSERPQMLTDAASVITEVRDSEMARAVADLRRLGVDWSVGEDQGASPVAVEISTTPEGGTARAGEPFGLKVRVTNNGEAPLFRLRAVTDSDYRLFDDRELVFGRLNPGETREWTTTLGVCVSDEDERRECRLPRDIPDRADGIRVTFQEEHGHAPEPVEVRTTVQALDRPQFAYSVHVADDIEGNGDGFLQRGEKASLYLRVKNVGQGQSFETHANLRNLAGRGIVLTAGRFRIDDIAPGQEKVVRFTFEVLEDFEREEAKLEISVIDADLRESVTENVSVPIRNAAQAPQARNGRVTIPQGTEVRAAPGADAHLLGRVEGGALSVAAQAEVGGFVRVELADEEPGWVPVAATSGSGRGGSLARAYDHMPPELEVAHGGDLVTRDDSITIRGTARDDQRVRDLYVYAGSQKVYYDANESGGDARTMSFETRVPLHGGINYITVFARESNEVVSRQLFVVRRDAADGSLMETPRHDEGVWGVPGEEEQAD